VHQKQKAKQAAEERVADKEGLPPRRISSFTVLELFALPAHVENVELIDLSLEKGNGEGSTKYSAGPISVESWQWTCLIRTTLRGASARLEPPHELAGLDIYLIMGLDCLHKQQQLVNNQLKPADLAVPLPLSVRRVKSITRHRDAAAADLWEAVVDMGPDTTANTLGNSTSGRPQTPDLDEWKNSSVQQRLAMSEEWAAWLGEGLLVGRRKEGVLVRCVSPSHSSRMSGETAQSSSALKSAPAAAMEGEDSQSQKSTGEERSESGSEERRKKSGSSRRAGLEWYVNFDSFHKVRV
jgi:hypothetical protein